MRVITQPGDHQIVFELRLDPEDGVNGVGQQGMEIELITDRASVRFERPTALPHPDLLALAALSFIRPWSRRRLTLSHGVSEQFANTVYETMGIELSPVDDALKARLPGKRLGLMYSGGPDCMAAELLLGQQLPLFHFRRVRHPRVPNRTRMQSGVQEAIVRKAAARGEELHVTPSDLEFLCRPFPTFPHWGALTIGAVLLAETADLGGIVSGRNISGIYLGWGKGFRPEGEHEAEWRRIYVAAGLDLIQPLAGASDIVSKQLAASHRLSDLARSCLVGTLDGPCHQCLKCLLTDVMNAAIRKLPLSEDLNASFASSKRIVKRYERPPPYPDQHLLEYSIPRIPGVEHTVLAHAATALAPSIRDTAWVERYYRPALGDHVPAELMPEVTRQLSERVAFMTTDEEAMVERWTPVS